MYKVKLTKRKSNHTDLTLDIYTGTCVDLPHVGEQFTMATHQEGALWTTKVKTIRYYQGGTLEFKTKNSTYFLEAKYEAS